ncbi:hypothetical protein [Nostoc sp. PCC 7107]|nr:hypothetical protein [Nostoc sp. PCC 7107]AFY41152.1 protein of unknown function DUF1995-containing protein [Nostoc sp. PCC 7107]
MTQLPDTLEDAIAQASEATKTALADDYSRNRGSKELIFFATSV